MYQAGLILEGGAMRGIFTAGVLDYLMEKECWLSYVVGVSIGSSNAVDYVSKQIGRTRDCIVLKDENERYINSNPFKWLKTRELFDLDLLYNRFPNELHPFDYNTYFNSPIECEIVASNCITGQADYLSEKWDKKRSMDLVAASSTLPVLSRTVEVDGVPYLDGGICDGVPLIHSMKKGYRKNVVILTRAKGYRKEPSKKMNFLFGKVYKKYPEIVKALKSQAARYNQTLELVEKWEEEGKIFVIRPETMTVKRTEQDNEKLQAFWQYGYDSMKERYEELIQYLES